MAREDAEAKDAETTMRVLATRLRAFGPGMFGAVDDEDYDSEISDSAVSPEDAELAAGALVWATDVWLSV